MSEIKGIVISDYQILLEEEWVNDLRLKYEVNVNAELLSLVDDKYVSSKFDASAFNQKFNCNDFQSCFLTTGQLFGYSKDVFFGWNNSIFTTEVNPLTMGDDE